MKKKLFTILAAIALLLPGIIAIANYTYLKNTPLEYRNLSHIDITDLSGDVFALEAGNDVNNHALDFFVKLNKNARPVDALPSELADTPAFIFTYHSYAIKSDYKYYFSLSPDNAYYVNDKGAAYKIAQEDASQFLCTCYARSLYSGSGLPTLTLSDANAVIPSTVKWTFRNVRSEYVDYANDYETTKTVANYDVSSDFGMKFSIAPDFFFVTISQGGTELYRGDYAELALPTALDLEKTATVEISAEWYQTVDRVCAGSATYRFEANLVPPPTFSLMSSDGEIAEKGSMLVLTGKNVKNAADISFTSEPAINYTPTWFENKQNGSVYALVPIPIDGNYADVSAFRFTVSAGGTENTLSIPYEDNTFQTLSGLSESTFDQDFAEISAQIAPPADGAVWFDGLFRNPVSTTSGLKGFGRMVDSAYRHNGVDFTNVRAGDTVHAAAAGTVAYAGSLPSGQIAVVLEHGLGLRTWYVGMNTVNADLTIGTQIGAGDTIGTCADGKLHCSVTVFDQPVSPYKFWSFTAEHTEFLKLK